MTNIVFVALLALLMVSNSSYQGHNKTLVSLSQAEITDLKFLREEEKLARDVYLYAYDKYQLHIFDNISRSEQRHMDSVIYLMNKYDIQDSASTERGVFNNPDLQKLYSSLTKQVDISSVEALKAGATIEDLDINDINHFTANSTNADLLNVYEKLNCGSKNHIRAFTRSLENNEVTYAPKYISTDDYATILRGSNGGCGRN
ncbi:DUF2202 domain-containing protein [Flavobacterium sp.]|jgi:hypothetical protein|uniref:DUF2202 domain-containing protein n=1 Tax=Flavobacterium sp. TaxID=239 RepID=UPI0037BF0AB2